MTLTQFNLFLQTYDIDTELKARKIIEKYSDYHYVFDKNEDKYGFDLIVFKYEINKGEFKKNKMGYIEIECATTWKTFKIPQNWYCVSFLKRKLYNYNFKEKVWGLPKPNLYKTIYLKFNQPMTNCFCQNMIYIIRNGQDSRRNDDINSYNNSFIELEKKSVYWGVKNCVNYIVKYLSRIYEKQVETVEVKDEYKLNNLTEEWGHLI